MPTIHVSNNVNEKIDELLVKLVTETQMKIKRSLVIELAFQKGFDNVTAEDVKEHLLKHP